MDRGIKIEQKSGRIEFGSEISLDIKPTCDYVMETVVEVKLPGLQSECITDNTVPVPTKTWENKNVFVYITKDPPVDRMKLATKLLEDRIKEIRKNKLN